MINDPDTFIFLPLNPYNNNELYEEVQILWYDNTEVKTCLQLHLNAPKNK